VQAPVTSGDESPSTTEIFSDFPVIAYNPWMQAQTCIRGLYAKISDRVVLRVLEHTDKAVLVPVVPLFRPIETD